MKKTIAPGVDPTSAHPPANSPPRAPSDGGLTYYILDPHLEQSLTLARILALQRPEATITGVCTEGRYPDRIPPFFGSLLTSLPTSLDPARDITIPAGARSTHDLISRTGPIKLGAITLTPNTLQVYDKLWTLSLADSMDIPTPRTWTDTRELSDKDFPVFYKATFEGAGRTRGVARDRDSLPAHPDAPLIYQELIRSQGTYGVGFLAEKGDLLVSHTHFERYSIPGTGGSAVVIEDFDDDRLLNHTRQLLGKMLYSGWGLAEFKYCPLRRDFVLMEINAKFWASCELALVNQPGFLRLLFGITTSMRRKRRLIYVNRALARGFFFAFGTLRFAFSARYILQPGWLAALRSAYAAKPRDPGRIGGS